MINKLSAGSKTKPKILFLGYGRKKTKIIHFLIEKGFPLWHSKDKVNSFAKYDLVISFGYRHIIEEKLLKNKMPILNLHMSYLPFNRGLTLTFGLIMKIPHRE